MKHKTVNIREPISQRHYPIRDELRDVAIKATKKLGGFAMIDDRYVIVDIQKYEIKAK